MSQKNNKANYSTFVCPLHSLVSLVNFAFPPLLNSFVIVCEVESELLPFWELSSVSMECLDKKRLAIQV